MKREKLETLQKVFGHKDFRPYQEEAVDALMHGRDLLTILPTGGGKSLIFQLPSLLMDGVTIVVSPLIALMQDQVTALKELGIEAQMISSAGTPQETAKTFDDLLSGKVKILYIAPERLANEQFFLGLQKIKINFFVIDEAHCVSEWGHEFRSEYRRLHRLKRLFPDIPIAAFTATATKKVAYDIENQLLLNDPLLVRSKTLRENLFINAQKRVGNGRKQLVSFLHSHQNECGIVYCFSRRETEDVAKFLQTKSIRAKAYHAGLSTEIRDEVYRDFLHERIDIVVATIAFGMGIDKSNIRFVAHTSMPKTMENYYQEIGRAGRDGLSSETLLLYSKGDEIQRAQMIEELEKSEYKDVLVKKLEQMYRYSVSGKCRHEMIAGYFDDDIDECGSMCDSCLKDDIQKIDITIEAQKFLSCIYRSGQNFGQNHIIDILRGSTNRKIHQFGHEKLSVYGIGKKRSKNEWEAVADRLYEIEAVKRGEHRTVVIGKSGFDILKKRLQVEIDEDKIGKVQKVEAHNKDDLVDSGAFEKFRELRLKIANKKEVPAYVIFSDKTLVELSRDLPCSKEEMLKVNGIGEVKYERYGEDFLFLSNEIRESKDCV